MLSKSNFITSSFDKRPSVVSLGYMPTNDLSLSYFNLMRSGDMTSFAADICPPPNTMIRAKVFLEKGFFNEYTFFIENPKGKDVPVMSTRRKKSSTNLSYWFNILNQTGPLLKFGKLSSNFTRSKYFLIGHIKEGKEDAADFNEADEPEQGGNRNRRRSITNSEASSRTNSNLIRKYFDLEIINKIFGQSKPKEISMDLCVPNEDRLNTNLSQSLRKTNKRIKLVTRKPDYDPSTKKFLLDFDGRAKLPSTSNLQIIEEEKNDEILLQLGKFDQQNYSLDFCQPFTAFSAFGFAVACLSRG